jgi:hypothetical protein
VFSFAAPILSQNTLVLPDVLIINGILAQGGTLDSTQQAAITTFITAVNSFWDKCVYFYGFMGGTANSHAVNWANIGVNTLSYGGTAATHSTNGVRFNGGWANTGLIPPPGNYCLSGYTRDGDSTQGTIPAGTGAPRFYAFAAPTVTGTAIHSAIQRTTSIPSPVKHYACQRTNSTTMEEYTNGSILSTYTQAQVNVTSSTILLGILRSGGVPAFPQGSSSVVQSYGLWEQLTPTEIDTLFDAETALNTTLGRN